MWNRYQLLKNLRRPLRYEVVRPKAIVPLGNLKKWDWLSQTVIRLRSFEKGWIYRRQKNYVNHVLFTGGDTGYGKTSAALWFAARMSDYYAVPFTIDNLFGGRVIPLSPELMAEQFEYHQIVFIDEVQHAFERMRATSEANVEANRYFDTIRKRGINTIMTTPSFDSVDRRIVEDKIKWWVHCHKNDEDRRQVHTYVYYRATSRNGKEADWITVERKVFKWVDSVFYEQATAKVTDKIYTVKGLEDYKQVRNQQIRDKQEEWLDNQIQIIIERPWNKARKVYRLLKLRVSKLRIRGYLTVSDYFISQVEAQMRLGVAEDKLQIGKKKERVLD